MIFYVQTNPSPTIELLSNMSAQSFFLGIAALLVLIVGTISFIYVQVKAYLDKPKILKTLTSNQREIMELLLDVDEVPVNEISNLITVKNLKSELVELKQKNLIRFQVKDDEKYILLNREEL